jgi:hypothetical protein
MTFSLQHVVRLSINCGGAEQESILSRIKALVFTLSVSTFYSYHRVCQKSNVPVATTSLTGSEMVLGNLDAF